MIRNRWQRPVTPISDDEWDAGSTQAGATEADTRPVGEFETEEDLIVAFPSENVDNAYTRGEILRGVHFGADARPETIREALVDIPAELVDLAGDVVASGMVLDDLDEALDDLVEADTVAERDVETEGGTTTYYRLDTNEAHE